MRGNTKTIVVGISGASGIVYGIRLLKALRDEGGIQTHLIMTRPAMVTLAHETQVKVSEVEALADVVHSNDDIGASIASGSFATDGMIIAPCSARTVAEIAAGTTVGLLTRAADVTLKERRKLILMMRETPLHAGHLRAMSQVTDMGAIVYPPVPAFYAKLQSLEEMVEHTVGRMLSLVDIETQLATPWLGGK